MQMASEIFLVLSKNWTTFTILDAMRYGSTPASLLPLETLVMMWLIAIRQAHKALQNTGEIDFIYAEKNAYPLAYLRTYDDEQILIVLNPSDREVSFHCSFIPVETIYRMGGNVSWCDETFTIAPQTSAFLKVQHIQ